MRLFAVALLLMLLVAKVVISQTCSFGQPIAEAETYLVPLLPTAVHRTLGSHHIGYTSCVYSYAKANQEALSVPGRNQRSSEGILFLHKLARAHNQPAGIRIVKKLVHGWAARLTGLVRQYIVRSYPACIRRITGRSHWVKFLRDRLSPVWVRAQGVKEYGNCCTFDATSDKGCTWADHQVVSTEPRIH